LHFKEKEAPQLEELLESLIKMVGRANQKVDCLQVRVRQLERFISENHLEVRERSPFQMYS
jgi:hypothetical protein